ncbi:MAG: TspO/MBR family protein [Eubacteriales bacterium]|nr:TspO/MBR family protein [Eubacteriales bacterium]
MKKKVKLKELVISLAIPLAVGALSALLTKDGMERFETLLKPPLSPPGWLFPIVWTALFILMGIACYKVWTSGASSIRRERALTLYGIQLAMNFMWSIIFFTMRMYLPAFIWLLVMLSFIVAAAVLFRYIDKKAGNLMIPYIVWCCYAAYLNFGVYLLNGH